MTHRNWEKYVENTARIRMLSSPNAPADMGAASYYTLLTANFTEIRDLAASNREILTTEIYPFLEDDGTLLDDDIVHDLKEMQDRLMDALNMENLDMTMVAQIADRLYADANRKQDVSYLIEQLDARVSTYYTLMNIQKRVAPYGNANEISRKKGFEAGKKLLSFLDKEQFARLPDEESKEMVLVNARYLCALYESLTDEQAKLDELELLRTALHLEEDEFYRQQAPEYDWKYHRMRTLEYLGLMLECGNRKGLTREESAEIWQYCNELYGLWKKDSSFKEYISESELVVWLNRAAYFAGKISREEYKTVLLEQYALRPSEQYSLNDIMRNVLFPLEYSLLLDPDAMTESEMHQLDGMYKSIQNYVTCMPITGSFGALLEYYFEIIRHYIELPGQTTFRDACLDGLAAMHPPTFVHTIMVGRIAKSFSKNLIRLHPEALTGLLGCEDAASVTAHSYELEDFIYNGALCHDFGKIPIMDTIFTYGRNLSDDEFILVKTHTVTGSGIMERYNSTRPYMDIARGHHRWYDNSRGYPEFDTSTSPVKLMIDLVACADCLDAATDSVGRSYNAGKEYGEVFEELISQSGTRYTPYIAELLQDPRTRNDVEYLLKEGRREVYYNTYLRLVNVQKSAQ